MNRSDIRGRAALAPRPPRHAKDQSLSRTRPPHAVCYTTHDIYRKMAGIGGFKFSQRRGRDVLGLGGRKKFFSLLPHASCLWHGNQSGNYGRSSQSLLSFRKSN